MAKGIPKSWLAVLPEPLLSSINSFSIIEKGRADTCCFSIKAGQELFAKISNRSAIKNEVETLNLLANNKSDLVFGFPDLYGSKEELLLTHKVCGQSITDRVEDLISGGLFADALANLHSLNSIKVKTNSIHFDLPNLAAFSQTLDFVDCKVSIKTQLIDNLSQALKVLADVPSILGFIHGDLTPDNLLLADNEQLIILDWELADLRDVRWDIATLCEELSLTDAQTEQLVVDYQSSRNMSELSFASGLIAWRFIYLVVCFIWALEEKQEYQTYLTKLYNKI